MISCFNSADNFIKNLKTNKNRKMIKDFNYVKYVLFHLFILDVSIKMKGWTRENFTFLIITFLTNNQKWNFLSHPFSDDLGRCAFSICNILITLPLNFERIVVQHRFIYLLLFEVWQRISKSSLITW